MSDRIAVMNQGRVLQVGAPDEIYERPATRFVAQFIGESNLLNGDVTGRDGSSAIVNANGVEFRAIVPTERSALFALRPEKISLTATPQQDINSLPGVVEDSVYLGTDVQYRVRVQQKLVLQVRQQNLGPAAAYRSGDQVYANWGPLATVPVTPDPDS